MAYAVGVLVFALGIVISVALHEAGHMGTARMFGMKVTRFFIGFGPTLFSFRRGDTEYGLKAIPAGAFVKIVGMTPQDDDVAEADQPRAMWRYPVWKRTIVMAAGSGAHFILGFVILWILTSFVGLPNIAKLPSSPATVAAVAPCLATKIEFDPQTKGLKDCDANTAPPSPAKQANLRAGDVITGINGRTIPTWGEMSTTVRGLGGQHATLEYKRDGQVQRAEVDIPVVERIKQDAIDKNKKPSEITADDIEKAGQLGITGAIPTEAVGPVKGIGETGHLVGVMFVGTFEAFKKFPEKIPALWNSLSGGERDPETPISVVGASRLGGELAEHNDYTTFLQILAVLNFFVGIFNLLPLLPLDGGHIAIAWFERVRSWLARLRGKPDPGRVDYFKLMPVTYAVIIIMGGFTLLTVAADIINPITLFAR